MAITVNGTDGNPMTSRDVDGTPNNFIYAAGKLAFSGSYVAGGDTLDWSAVMPLVASSSAPLQVSVTSQNGSVNSYVPVQGSGISNWKLKIFTAGGTELAAGAYPAGVTGDTVIWQAQFRKLL